MIDEIDRKILEALQAEARISNAELARQVGMAPSAILERVRKLEERGMILGYSARLGPKPLGAGLVAFVAVRAEERMGAPETAARLAELPEIQEVHHIAGEDCFLAKVRVADVEALGKLLRERIGSIPTVRSTKTTIVLETVKETSAVPIPSASEAKGERS